MATSASGIQNAFTRTGQFLVYGFFRAVEALIGVLSLEWVARIGRTCGSIAYYAFPAYRKLALSNLSIAFGREKDEKWRREIARKHFQSLGSNFLCGLKLPLMPEEEVATHVTVEGLHHAEAVEATGKSLLFALCHLSCWELLTQTRSLYCLGKIPASVYQPLSNPFMEAHVKRRREKLNYTLFDRSKGFAGPMKHLRGGTGILGVLADQHAGDKGVWCPFFDRLASTSNLAALIALRCETPLMLMAVYDDGPTRWRIVCHPPVHSLEPKPTAEGITAMMNTAIENVVRQAPENWFWVHNRWKTPKPDFLLAQYRRGVTLPVGYDAGRLQPFRVLVRSPNWLGDACMVLPAVRALRKGRPDMAITVLAPAKLAGFWSTIADVEAVILKDAKDSPGAVGRRIRSAGRFDAAILFTNSVRSALEIWRAGVPRRVGYRGSLRSWLINQTIREPRANRPPEHQVHRYLRIVQQCGGDIGDPALLAFPPAPAATQALRIGLCAGAEYGPAKRWPLERFAETAHRVSARVPDVEWVLVGAPNEKEMGRQLSTLLTGVRHQNMVGQTSLAELIVELKLCRLLLTNDTGTMHLAAVLGVPTVSIFGSTEPILTGPLGSGHTILRHHVPCSPCFMRECPFGHYDCMTGVTPERVETEVVRAILRYSDVVLNPH